MPRTNWAGVSKKVLIMALSGILAACASTKSKDQEGNRITRTTKETATGVSTAAKDTKDGFGDAMATPAEDLNLRRDEIPQLLLDIESPYDPVPTSNCRRLATMVEDLNAVLGPDVDDVDPRSSGEKVGENVADATLGAVSDVTGSIIPFRSLVRRATGATRWERKVRQAYQRGLLRRAYLKGFGHVIGCKPPAAPRRDS